MSIGSRLFSLLFHAPWVVRGALSRSALPAFNRSSNVNARVNSPHAGFWERSTSLPTPRGDFRSSRHRFLTPSHPSARGVPPSSSRGSRIRQVGARRWMTIPNLAVRLRALNRPEGTLTKRKKSAFSRRTSMERLAALATEGVGPHLSPSLNFARFSVEQHFDSLR